MNRKVGNAGYKTTSSWGGAGHPSLLPQSISVLTFRGLPIKLCLHRFLCILLSALSILAAPVMGSLGTLLGFLHHLCHESTKWNSWGQSPESCGQSWLSQVSSSPWRTWRMCISICRNKTQFLHFSESPGAKPGPLPLHFSFRCSSYMRFPVAFSWVVFQRTLVPSPELLCPTLMW